MSHADGQGGSIRMDEHNRNISAPARLLRELQARWRNLSTGSVNRKIFGAAFIIGTMTLGMKAISMVKESFVAASYGTGNAYDAYVVGLAIPMMIVGILSGSLNAALIPTYIEVREREGTEAAHRLYTSILLWNILLLVALTFAMATTAHLWLPRYAPGFDAAKLALARQLLLWSLPIVIVTGFSMTWGALLNAGERFALVAIAPVLQPLATIIALGLLLRTAGIWALLTGAMLGSLLEMALLGFALSRRGHPLMPRWHGTTVAFKRVRAQYWPCIAGAFLMSGISAVDEYFAATLGPRSNSALSYGSKLVGFVLSLGASALGTAVLPQLSKMVAGRKWPEIKHFLKVYTRLIFGVMIPATVLLILLSRFIVQLMYQRGAFVSADTDLVVKIQIFYLLRVPFSTALVLVTRTLTALRANHYMTIMSIGTFILNAVLDYLFILRWGIAGITLSTSACSVMVFTCLTIVLHMELNKRASAAQEP